MAQRTRAATGASAKAPKARRAAPPATGEVEAALEQELKTIGVKVKDSALAATAKAMARSIDDTDNSATSRSLCAARLIDALNRLRELNPPQEGMTPLDEIRARRERRISRA